VVNNLKHFSVHHYDINFLKQSGLTAELIKRFRVVPFQKDEQTFYLGMSAPLKQETITAFEFQTGLSIHPIVLEDNDIDWFIEKYAHTLALQNQLEDTLAKLSDENALSINDDAEPVTDFVNQLLSDAIVKNVSDIHIEPQHNNYRIRFRHDGLLYEVATIPVHLALRVITRLKVMGQLNIAERRLPQDGRLQHHSFNHKNIRINICPVLHGEKIVLRILDHHTLTINDLGFSEKQKSLFLNKINSPEGLIIVTGPTGSGKTITLYAALQAINVNEKNIVTIEDPVEIELPGINQINVNPKIGMTFAQGLRSMLRQDPNIIMVGEIRDQSTAHLAIEAAHTGHLVLSTLHTKSALETVMRLLSLNITTHHLWSAMILIIGQRLVRKLCNVCKHQMNDEAYTAVGCEQCHQGYKGRMGVYEFLPLSRKAQESILLCETIHEMLIYLKKYSHESLWEEGLNLVKQGLTSKEEIERVIGKQ